MEEFVRYAIDEVARMAMLSKYAGLSVSWRRLPVAASHDQYFI